MSASKILSGKKIKVYDPINDLAEKISAVTSNRLMNDDKITQIALSTESLDQSQEQMITNVYNSMESNVKAIAADFGISVEDYQLEAATIGGMISANVKYALSSQPKKAGMLDGFNGSRFGVTDGQVERPIAMEAYDERDNRNSQVYSIVYNLLASRQDDFGETFFPTIVVNPNEMGITLTAKIFYAFNDFKRAVTGSLANYARKNLVRAYADSSILFNEQTKAIPVFRQTGGTDDNTDKFVPAALLTPWVETLSNTSSVTTSAIAVGKKLDLIGISQTNELLASGIMSPSDTLDTYIRLEKLFVKVVNGATTDMVQFDVSELPGATFTYSPSGNYRKMILNLDSDSLVVTPTTAKVDGAPLAALTEFTTNNWSGLMRVSISGNVVIDKGDSIVNPGSLELVAVRDSLGNLVAPTAPDHVTAAAKITSAEIVGYTVTAYRANSNLRQRGQLVDSQIEYQPIPVLYRSPISAIMPAIDNSGDNTAVLQTLITTTGIRISNEAVTALLKAEQSLSSYNPIADTSGNIPELFGIGRFYVKPAFFSETINLSLTVDSLKSHERAKDIKAAIVEKLRFYAAEMYRSSEYKAAAMVLTGNIGFKPTVIIGTDSVLYNYIMVDGDLRTLGDQFDVKVVSSLDSRVSGKIFMSFGVQDSGQNSTVNPLNFGNMLWSPEVTAVLPVSRDGNVNQELLVSPRFLHLVNLPVLCVLNVSNIPTGKVALNQHIV